MMNICSLVRSSGSSNVSPLLPMIPAFSVLYIQLVSTVMDSFETDNLRVSMSKPYRYFLSMSATYIPLKLGSSLPSPPQYSCVCTVAPLLPAVYL